MIKPGRVDTANPSVCWGSPIFKLTAMKHTGEAAEQNWEQFHNYLILL
jgi:hypothetical protein